MVKFNHMELPVSDCRASRDFYVGNFGFEVEFSDAEHDIIAIRDGADFTIFLRSAELPSGGARCALTFEVDDVDAKHAELAARAIRFEKPPGKYFWGYGAELRDPDGYLLMLWDEKSMREKGGG